jgi:hypothetical protein
VSQGPGKCRWPGSAPRGSRTTPWRALGPVLAIGYRTTRAYVAAAVELACPAPPAVGSGPGRPTPGLAGAAVAEATPTLTRDTVGFVDRHVAVHARGNRVPGSGIGGSADRPANRPADRRARARARFGDPRCPGWNRSTADPTSAAPPSGSVSLGAHWPPLSGAPIPFRTIRTPNGPGKVPIAPTWAAATRRPRTTRAGAEAGTADHPACGRRLPSPEEPPAPSSGSLPAAPRQPQTGPETPLTRPLSSLSAGSDSLVTKRAFHVPMESRS